MDVLPVAQPTNVNHLHQKSAMGSHLFWFINSCEKRCTLHDGSPVHYCKSKTRKTAFEDRGQTNHVTTPTHAWLCRCHWPQMHPHHMPCHASSQPKMSEQKLTATAINQYSQDAAVDNHAVHTFYMDLWPWPSVPKKLRSFPIHLQQNQDQMSVGSKEWAWLITLPSPHTL